MTLEDLRAFCAAYQAGSMSEAARRLGCTQAAVAQHVRRLERELGAELLARLRRGVDLTELGRTLYEAASGSLANLELAVRQIEQSLQQREGRVRLTASANLVTRYMRRSILTLRERHPNVVMEVEPANTAEDRLEALRQGRADLAVIPLTDPVRSLEVRPYVELPLGLLVPRDHPFARRKRLKLSELSGIRYIAQSPTSATYRHVERALREAGVPLEPSQIIEDHGTAVLTVEIGRGETFVPSDFARGFERSGLARVVPVPALPPIRVVWVARDFSLLPKAATDFIAICDEIAHPRAS